MAHLNTIQVIGNVGREPEMRYLQNGTAVCSFSVAVTKRWKSGNGEQRENTRWVRVSAWRGLAETANSFVRKGMQVFVEGEAEASAYINKSGEAVATLEITASNIVFLGARGDNHDAGSDEPGEPADDADVTEIPF